MAQKRIADRLWRGPPARSAGGVPARAILSDHRAYPVRAIFPIAGVTLTFAAYEALKQILLPDLTRWQSHAMSIVVVALLTTAGSVWVQRLLHAHIARGAELAARLGQDERFRALIQHAADGVAVVEPDGTMRYLSPAVERMLGYPAAALIGTDLFALVHPDDRRRARMAYAALRDATSHVPGPAVALRARHSDGTWRPIETVGANLLAEPSVEGIVLTVRDVAARHQAEQALRTREEEFRAIFDQAAVGIALLTLDGRYLRVNDLLCALLGQARADLLGRPWMETTASDEATRACNAIAQLLAEPGQIYAADQRHVRKDGATLWAHVTLSVQRDAQGTAQYLLLVLEDCSARVLAEAGARRAGERYRQMFETNRAVKLVVDAGTGQILDANSAACGFYGYSRAAIVALRIWDVNVLPEAEVRAAMGRAARVESPSFTVPHRLASGEIRDVELYSGPLEIQGRTVLYSIIHDVTERMRAEVALRHQASHDSLTDLPNRGILHERLAETLRAAHEHGKHVSLLLLDLDRFKDVNDTLGHHIGDLLLRQLATRLQDALGARDVVARLGGDEFAIVLPAADIDAASGVAELLLGTLEPPFQVEQHLLDLGGSIGIAVYPEHGGDAKTLLRHADVAMYVAKRAHGGAAIYDPAHDQHSVRLLLLSRDLRRAIRDAELLLHYQPKVALATGQVCGVEALLRWPHPTHGLVAPADFIPLAEASAMILPLTDWVLATALEQAHAWRAAGQILPVAANLSARSLQDARLPDVIARLLARHAVAPGDLTLEITESTIMVDPTRAMAVLTRLHAIGVRLAIDDFGTGYSSLGYLKTLPVDEVKIDRSFVQGMGSGDRKDEAIVRAVVAMAHALGLTVVAEGVEDAATHALLGSLGCDIAQGYYLGRPQPVAALDAWLRSAPWWTPRVHSSSPES